MSTTILLIYTPHFSSKGAETARRASASSTRPRRGTGTAAAARAAAIGNYRRRKQISTTDGNVVDPDEVGATAVNKTSENKSEVAHTAVDVYAEDKTQVQDVDQIPPPPNEEVVAIKPTGEIKGKSLFQRFKQKLRKKSIGYFFGVVC